ncbi:MULTISPECIES: MFS transporter [unclassified Streptomyces]|uniref:MFS transporter n=1 Tax=unclassified Streptomyces TaxID=2593676 RepID=UPI0023655932|nr:MULTISPECIES: MFS transporter [unclassified Streptomyces]MDF3139921.1 MFS transporter [Streptomyces sp. T21Q-yed]WDF44008.1 MFS transporter [Streptomyces sp. T12]
MTTLLHTVGTGLVVTLTTIYFTRVVGISVERLGLGLTVSGLVSLLVGVPFGRLSDRVGPRGLLACLLVCQGVAVFLHGFVHSFGVFVAVTGLLAIANQGASAVRSALIARAMPPEERVVSRAYLRSVTNVGFAIGAALASVGLASSGRTVYEVLFCFGALCFVGAAAAMYGVPAVAPAEHTTPVSPWLALRDGPFASVVVVTSILQLHYAVLEVGIPLWVSEHTDAPRQLVSVLFLLNTLFVFIFQVPVGRRWGGLRQAGPICAVAGALVACACLLLGVSAATTGVLTVALLVAAGCVHVVGEICHTTGSWAAGFGLAPDHAQGQYQGLFSTGMAASQMAGPVLVTTVVTSGALTGWLVAAGLFVLSGLLTPLLIGWAMRTRAVDEATA